MVSLSVRLRRQEKVCSRRKRVKMERMKSPSLQSP